MFKKTGNSRIYLRVWRRVLVSNFRTFTAMARNKITLTEQEETLRQLLLDVSAYVATHSNYEKPTIRFTGGWVRDKLLHVDSKDIDIGISSMTGFDFGNWMKKFLAEPNVKGRYGEGVLGGLAKIEANPEKSKHLETVTTKVLGLEIDLVNLRKEMYVENSRNPTMQFGTPEEDALRRDATINALFYNLETGEIEDHTGKGLTDMNLKIIRTPLPPHQTFMDDPLRVLRCIRFASRLKYSIDFEAEDSMKDSRIKEALRGKISRERIGVEVEKMLKGPHPAVALSFVDSFGLYDTIFTDPTLAEEQHVDSQHWHRAYKQLSEILQDPGSIPFSQLRSRLITVDHDIYLAWILCTVTPWARGQQSKSSQRGSKGLLPAAALVAREGLKIENRTMEIIKNAVLHMDEIIACKNAALELEGVPSMPMKRKHDVSTRESWGMSMRRWGPHWRSSIMFAILVEVTTLGSDAERERLAGGYTNWLSCLEKLDLMDVHKLKPIVDGNRLKKELGKPPGNWLKDALDIVVRWQLRNPDQNDPEGAIREVAERYN